VPAALAGDHYLLKIEKEEWIRGVKISKPQTRFYSINDFREAQADQYFEKHSYSVEILHNPNLTSEEVEEEETGSKPKSGAKKKEDYILEYATLMEVSVDDIDPKMTIKELAEEIAKVKANKGIS
jgi:hypothetical protein